MLTMEIRATTSWPAPLLPPMVDLLELAGKEFGVFSAAGIPAGADLGVVVHFEDLGAVAPSQLIGADIFFDLGAPNGNFFGVDNVPVKLIEDINFDEIYGPGSDIIINSGLTSNLIGIGGEIHLSHNGEAQSGLVFELGKLPTGAFAPSKIWGAVWEKN